ncbi:hypothetical protein FVER53590_12481 [Fusarium verticillioides]|nr:hypothetical protein FVER53590_12481 [Fusarium verticillioides]
MTADGERNGGNTKGLALVAARTLAEHCEYLIYTAASFLYKEHKQYQSTSHTTAMDTFPSGFVENTWHQPSGYPAFPSPPDTHLGFHGLDPSSALVNAPNDMTQLDPWFCQRWLDNSGDVQTEAPANSVHSQGSSATPYLEYGIHDNVQPAQEEYSCEMSKTQQQAKPKSRKSTAVVKQSNSCKGDQSQNSEQDRASRIRERNRNIARKYRNRKHHEAEAMETYVEKLQGENAMLRARCNRLTEEVLDLRSLLLQHSECNCTMIQAFIVAEAKQSLQSLLSPNPSG